VKIAQMATSKHVEYSSGSDNSNDPLRRLATGEMEVGATDVARPHLMRPVGHTAVVSQKRLDFEHRRPRWLREMLAEMTGVFFYVWVFIQCRSMALLILQ